MLGCGSMLFTYSVSGISTGGRTDIYSNRSFKCTFLGPLASSLCNKFGFRVVTMLGGLLGGISFASIFFYDEFVFLFIMASGIGGKQRLLMIESSNFCLV